MTPTRFWFRPGWGITRTIRTVGQLRAVLLLPYLDQMPIYSLWDLRYLASTQPPAAYQCILAVYHCPSRPAFVLSSGDFVAAGGGLGDYGCCFGTDADGSNSNGAIIPTAEMAKTVTTDASGKSAVLSGADN